MSKEVLGDRRKALEDSFFAKQDAKLRRELLEKETLNVRKAALSEVSGISDDAVLEHLIALDIGPDALTALTLVPLIEVAWADGNVDAHERDAILEAASSAGLGKGSPSARLLEGWLQERPAPDVLAAWKEYVSALLVTLSADAKEALKKDLLGRAHAVAEAAGGFMGLGNKVSKSEQAVLEDLESIFA
jgi:tellurite resistance protein